MISVGPKLETDFSSQLRAALGAFGIKSVKTNDRTTRGIPDIYFPHGNWIESKVVPGMAWARNPPMRYFRALQKSTMDDFLIGGDMCFVAILWIVNLRGKYFLFMPWWHFRRILYFDMPTLQHFGTSVDKKNLMFDMSRFFPEGKWDPTWFNERFNAWEHKDNILRFDPNRSEPTLAELVERENGPDDAE